MNFDELREVFAGILLPLILGAAGCFVRAMRFGVKGWRQLFSSLTASCFAAVLVYWGLDLLSFPPTVDAAIVGMSGYMGGMLLDAFHARALQEVDGGEMRRGHRDRSREEYGGEEEN